MLQYLVALTYQVGLEECRSQQQGGMRHATMALSKEDSSASSRVRLPIGGDELVPTLYS